MKRKLIRRRLLLVFGGLLVFLVLFAHPYFALNRPSGGRVLVAEGWMHREGLIEARDLFRRGKYDHLYITGTLRPFAYYLEVDEAIRLRFSRPVMRSLEINAGGLPTTRWAVMNGADTLISEHATKKATSYSVDLLGKRITELRFIAFTQDAPGPGIPIAFIGTFNVDGAEAHAVAEVMLEHADGTLTPGWHTHAEEARAILIEEGVPEGDITAVPTVHYTGGRTYASARTFIQYARTHGIPAFDVATLAVHARRTYRGYVVANGSRQGIGILALYDPWCRRWTWWLNPYGWYQVIKEILALPATVFDGTTN